MNQVLCQFLKLTKEKVLKEECYLVLSYSPMPEFFLFFIQR